MTTLTVKELTALHSLAGKTAGDELDWINAADASMLESLGLAVRTQCGCWLITEEGQAVVDEQQRTCTRRQTEYKPH